MANDPTTQDLGAAVTSVEPTAKERVLKGIGGAVAGATGASSQSLDDAISRHQESRLNEARMHRKNAATYAAIIATGKDPATGNLLSPEEEQKYNDWYQASMAAYEKAAGVNKETKGAIGKAKMVAEHIIGLGRKQREAGGAQGAAAGGTTGAQAGLPPPPQRAAGPTAQGDASVDASPGATKATGGGLPPPPGYTPQVAMGGDALRQQQSETQQLDLYKRKQQILYDEKVREDAAKAKARQQSTPRPVKSNAISVLDARTLAGDGKIFVDGEGQPIDVGQLPESMGLISFVVKNPDNGQWETVYQPFSPNQSTLTVGGESYAISPMDKSKVVQGKGTDLGVHNIPSTSHHYDPTTGQTDTTTRTPQVTGAAGRGGITAPPSAQPRSGAAPAQKPSAGAGGPRAAGSAIPVDADGHIPPDWKGATPQVIEAANQLIDDRDVDKIPAKVRELGASLARKTGWSQDKFTPKERAQLRVAVGFLDDMAKSPSLSVLDNTGSRLKLNQVLAGSDKQSAIGGTLTTLASSNMSPAEADFVRQYNMTVQAISGMASFTRGGNKATEAGIKRLLADLPNPKTVRDSKDAQARLGLLLTEARRILQRGTFKEEDIPTSGKSKLPGPPKSSSSAAPSRQKWGRDAQNNIVPLPASP